ncbi:unnamed protein product [Ceutorhynchus assimilis]|uniref:Uncharacterized protein n=1 Tax=Ceutorhynchus assimilis TaxID=467358 RepID=A0A9N9MB98_9CUCU|nr:unnamed protein product [Ceutorhynchus assimilis]
MEGVELLAEDQQKLFNLMLKVNQQQTQEITAKIEATTTNLSTTIQETKLEIDSIKKRCSFIEKKLRKNNIVIFGAKSQPQQTAGLLTSCVTLLNNLLGTNISEQDINNIYKIGKEENPPIVIEFISYLKKLTVYENKENLKKLKEHGITISNDLSPSEREEQKLLRKHLQIARTQNHETKILGNKLIIDNMEYTPQELKEIEANASHSESAEEEENEAIKNTEKSEKTGRNNKDKKPVAQRNNERQTKRKRLMVKYSPKYTRNTKKSES